MLSCSWRRKVIVVPYVRAKHSNRVLMLVVKDKLHDEWTFISGGCKQFETNDQSAVRELREETRAAVQLDLSKCSFTKLALQTDYREPSELARDASVQVLTQYHIYLIDITHYKPIPAIVRAFRRRGGLMRGVYDENNDIQFLPLQAFARRANVWPFIKNVVLKDPCFRYHCSTLRSLPPCAALSSSAQPCASGAAAPWSPARGCSC